MHEDMQPTVGIFGKVAVLMGGDSAERDISLLSGQAVLDSLLKSGHRQEVVQEARGRRV